MEQISSTSGATSVPALRRAVAILDLLSTGANEPTMAEVARLIGMPKSTAHGLLLAMEEMGLITRTASGGLRIGAHPLRWTNGFLAQTDQVKIFTEHFAHHRELSRFTVTMTILEGTEVVYIACTQTNQPLGVTFRIGMRLPAPFTATGKALLACLPADEVNRRLAAPGFPPPLTEHSVQTLDNLHTELAATSARGFSIDDGQVRPGMICLGAVVRNYSGAAIAGIALSLTRSEATAQTVQSLGTTLKEAADAISGQLGYLAG